MIGCVYPSKIFCENGGGCGESDPIFLTGSCGFCFHKSSFESNSTDLGFLNERIFYDGTVCCSFS
jgi:hypothetical protein